MDLHPAHASNPPDEHSPRASSDLPLRRSRRPRKIAHPYAESDLPAEDDDDYFDDGASGNVTTTKVQAKRTTAVHSHVCGVCNKAFGKRADLMRHRMKHTGERPFPCSECNAAFIQVCSRSYSYVYMTLT